MSKLCVINVVGLTPRLLQHAPHIAALGTAQPFRSPLPAVTCTSQATMLTGLMPRDHGIVGNGWYFRETQEIRFWQQASSLMSGERFYEGYETAKLFWWFNQSAPVRWSATPKPHYGSDGSKVFDIIDETDCELTSRLGPFPFFSFWGPHAGLPSSRWIADAAAIVIERNAPEVTLVYLPHLDYDFQRYSHHDPARVAEVDRCAQTVIDAAARQGIQSIVVSEYGLVPVSRPVSINRVLREQGWLVVRDGPFGEMLMPGSSQAFAVADHQLAHVYVNQPSLRDRVRDRLRAVPGIADVVEPGSLGLDHPRSGEWVALAEPDAWFTYYYWNDDRRAPDFATSVDIHRKPGYDPCELFMTSKFRAMGRLAQKKLGLRYRMDVIPLDASLVNGSHGLHPDPMDGPVIVGPHPPDAMTDFKAYARGLLGSAAEAQ
ncbi:MAG: alkaline phosphatase family protein [Planctomycetaceae bacterium]